MAFIQLFEVEALEPEWMLQDARIWQATQKYVCISHAAREGAHRNMFAFCIQKTEKKKVPLSHTAKVKITLSCFIFLSTPWPLVLSEIRVSDNLNDMLVIYSDAPRNEELWGNEFPLSGWWWARWYGFFSVYICCHCVVLIYLGKVRMRVFFLK